MKIMMSLLKKLKGITFGKGKINIHIHVLMSLNHFVSFYTQIVGTWTLTSLCPFDRALHNSQKKTVVPCGLLQKCNCRKSSTGCNKRNHTLDIGKSITWLPTNDITVIRTEIIKIIL